MALTQAQLVAAAADAASTLDARSATPPTAHVLQVATSAALTNGSALPLILLEANLHLNLGQL